MAAPTAADGILARTIGEWISGLAQEASAFCSAQGRPLVTLSYAQSLDGSLALKRGQGLALSGPDSLRLTHSLRAAHDAILVGIGTVLADDPQLSVRLAPGKNPRPVVLDSRLRIPLDSRLLARNENLPWILAGGDVPETLIQPVEACGGRVIRVARDAEGRIDLRAGLRRLAEKGVTSLMVEGGAGVLTQFLALRLFDYAVITIAPLWAGGLASVERSMFSDGVFPALEAPVYLTYGRDGVVWGRAGTRKGQG